MFRLNGDIIKQLENIYHIKFLQKYKTELKERIIFFLHTKLKDYLCDDILLSIKNMNEVVLFVDNEPNLIKASFIEKYKEEIFNSFNPLWYVSEIKIHTHLSSKDLNIQLNLLKLNSARQLDDLCLFDLTYFPSFSEIGYLYSFCDYEFKELSINQLNKIELKLIKELNKKMATLEINTYKLDLFKEFILTHSVNRKITALDLDFICSNNNIVNSIDDSKPQFYYYLFSSLINYETIKFVKKRLSEKME